MAELNHFSKFSDRPGSMREEIVQLRKLHISNDSFEASEFVTDILREEVQQLRQMSHHGTFHAYIKNKGYPLPEEVILSSSYLKRPTLEDKFRNAINSGKNVILVGCEGSGKTTLVHYVVGTTSEDKLGTVIYIDTSDIEGANESEIEEILAKKIVNAVNRVSHSSTGKKFEDWVNKCKNDIFLQSVINVESSFGFVEAFLVYLRTQDDNHISYVILDNLDSLSVRANKTLFSALNRINETVLSVANRFKVPDTQNIRYIIGCRTPTYEHLSGTALGLFLNFPYVEILFEQNFLQETSLVELMDKFLLNEDGRAYKEISGKSVEVRIDGYSISSNMGDYFSDTIIWLRNYENLVNRTIKMFCGRSIRRAKLFSLKVLAHPVIARHVWQEKYEVGDKNRHDNTYFTRKIIEAVFDFQSFGSGSFPMNPFRVVLDEVDFKSNPLIGIVGIHFLNDNRQEMADKKICFASSIDVEKLVTYFGDIGYTKTAIFDFFSATRDSGLLRPVPSSEILLEDLANEHRSIHTKYVIDDTALSNLISLLTAKNAKESMSFFNSAIRARYSLGGPRRIDNWLTEAFTTLVFLTDFLERERHLEAMVERSGLMITSPSTRFQSQLMPTLSGIVSTFVDGNDEGGSPDTAGTTVFQVRSECQRLLRESQERMRQRSSII